MKKKRSKPTWSNLSNCDLNKIMINKIPIDEIEKESSNKKELKTI